MTVKAKTSKSIAKAKVKQTSSSTPSAKAKLSVFEVHYPSEVDWKNLINDLGLKKNKNAKIELWEFIGDMIADVLIFQKVQKSQIDRNDGIRRIKNLDARILNLKNALREDKGKLTEIVPYAALEELGELFTIGAASIAAKKRRFPEDSLPTTSEKFDKLEIHTLEGVENFYVGLRRDNGLLYGSALLQLALETLHKPIREWLTKNSTNPGGRPKKSIRDMMIHRTIIHAEKILKLTPETKKGGQFMSFCNLCLVTCGVPEDGLDKAIAAAINKRTNKTKPVSKHSESKRSAKS